MAVHDRSSEHPARRDCRVLGLAGRLVRARAYGIRARGETPFLHVVADNTPAIRLYESIGFEVRVPIRFAAVRSPMATPG
ncbi:GNAT family N-acetyltransferase [Actinoplanes sp. NPDC023936]|uniref:GNAT family N-acetyltransferase n=1 Tax=Actinoplanes sp. NPDC023936 TaxID=3154910 RepID=UPI0034093145